MRCQVFRETFHENSVLSGEQLVRLSEEKAAMSDLDVKEGQDAGT